MRFAVLVLLCVLGGCASDAPGKPELAGTKAPSDIIVVTKSQVTYRGRLVRSSGTIHPSTPHSEAQLVMPDAFSPRNVDASALLVFMVLGAGLGALFTVRQTSDARRVFADGASDEVATAVAKQLIRGHLARVVKVLAGCVVGAVAIAFAPGSLFGGYDNSATLEARLAVFVAPAVLAAVHLTILVRLRTALAALDGWASVRSADRYLYVVRNRELVAWVAAGAHELEKIASETIPKATARRGS